MEPSRRDSMGESIDWPHYRETVLHFGDPVTWSVPVRRFAADASSRLDTFGLTGSFAVISAFHPSPQRLDREANLETSTAAFYGAVFTKGRRLGLLAEDYAEPCERAWLALLSRIDDEGGAFGTSAVTWAANLASEDLALYRSAPTEVNVWGQGAALRFSAERIRLMQAN